MSSETTAPATRTRTSTSRASKSKFVQDCLCLVCRQPGHLVGKCPWFSWKEKHPDSPCPPDIERIRQFPPFAPSYHPATDDATQTMCQRCADLRHWNMIERHSPWVKSDVYQKSRAAKKMDQMASLGPIRSLKLLSTCPLCRFIFNITFLTDEDISLAKPGGKLVLVTAWMSGRLEPDLVWEGNEKGKGPYAKCVYTSATLWPQQADHHKLNTSVEDAVDAIAAANIGKSKANGIGSLGIRKVDPRCPDYNRIKHWLHLCDALHPVTCRPLVSDDVLKQLRQIKLVDVTTRRIVMYPPAGCEYLAVSYVWGAVTQPSYQLGHVLETVPATLEDAMTVTRNLGKRYLWADSLCIDQGNESEKAVQITLMSAIYSGAWATIVALSGLSADSGLPRVGPQTLPNVIPQLSFELWGKELLSVMPTLSQQISWSRWSTRAWTFQEGKLSPRRLFFTNHQVYFECNSFQCCESLDESSSPFHLASNDEQGAVLRGPIADPENIIGKGVLRDPFRPLATPEDTHLYTDDQRYLNLVNTYTARKMTQDTDSLNAFHAMLTRLGETCYKKGFAYGLPVEDMGRALSWYHSSPSRRRVDFPMWSWAGWEGVVADEYINGGEDLDKLLTPPLRVWKAGDDGRPELIYDMNLARQNNELEGSLDKEEEEVPKDSDSDSDSDSEEESDSDSDSHSSDDDSEEESSPDSSDSDSSSSSNDDGPTEPDSSVHGGDKSNNDTWTKELRATLPHDPILRLANIMLDDIPPLPQTLDPHELVIDGIVLRITFVRDDNWVSLWGNDKMSFIVTGDDEGRMDLEFEGHDAAALIVARQGKEQEFLLLSREHTHSESSTTALLLFDRDGKDGDTAYRVGMARLPLYHVREFERFKPERKLLRFR